MKLRIIVKFQSVVIDVTVIQKYGMRGRVNVQNYLVHWDLPPGQEVVVNYK